MSYCPSFNRERILELEKVRDSLQGQKDELQVSFSKCSKLAR